MTIPQTEKFNQEVCSIRIMFPVVTDEKAIEIKRKIDQLLADTPNAHTQFSLMDTPPKAPSM